MLAELQRGARERVVSRRAGLTTNYAVAHAVKAVDVDVVAVYPITPQTTIVEKIAEFIHGGELRAELIHVESEHSALSAAVGAAAAGARTFTATSSQGLEYMHEVLHIASGLRLPIVMAVPTRALSAPISIHNDYSDIMNARDTGWAILIASTAQEAYDTVIQAYRIAEHPDVQLPVMMAYDGYLMSHTLEPVELYHEEHVRGFVPRRDRRNVLDVRSPITLGAFATPDNYYEFKYQQEVALRNVEGVLREVEADFAARFGASYGPVEAYRLEDADYALVTYGGAATGNARMAVDMARERGIRAGLLRVRLYRPFPSAPIVAALAGVKAFAVIDRAIAYGSPAPGPLYKDVATALYMEGLTVPGISVVHGIGQRAMYVEDFYGVIRMLAEGAGTGKVLFLGLRE